VNGNQFPNEGLTLRIYHEKKSVLGYRTLLEESGIHHSNTGQEITHDMYIKCYFMLLFDLATDTARRRLISPTPRTAISEKN